MDDSAAEESAHRTISLESGYIGSPTIEHFPEEVLSMIWNLLPPSDLLACRLVCQRWARLIRLPCGIMSDEPALFQLLSHAIFRHVDTLIIQDCPLKTLPVLAETEDVIPSYVRRLEIGGRFNSMAGELHAIAQYCGQLQELKITGCALSMTGYNAVGYWEFQNLKSLEVEVVPAPSSSWTTQVVMQLFESHMNNLEELFNKEYPKLEQVSAVFEYTNKWQHYHYNNVLLPSCLEEFAEFLCRNAAAIMKLDVKDIVCGNDILKRLTAGLLQRINVISCTVDMEALRDYGVPSFDDCRDLLSFVEWVKAVPADDLEYMSYTFEYTYRRRALVPTPTNAVGESATLVIIQGQRRISANLRITVRPIYNVRHLMLCH